MVCCYIYPPILRLVTAKRRFTTTNCRARGFAVMIHSHSNGVIDGAPITSHHVLSTVLTRPTSVCRSPRYATNLTWSVCQYDFHEIALLAAVLRYHRDVFRVLTCVSTVNEIFVTMESHFRVDMFIFRHGLYYGGDAENHLPANIDAWQ